MSIFLDLSVLTAPFLSKLTQTCPQNMQMSAKKKESLKLSTTVERLMNILKKKRVVQLEKPTSRKMRFGHAFHSHVAIVNNHVFVAIYT